jgi:hypothetical protein
MPVNHLSTRQMRQFQTPFRPGDNSISLTCNYRHFPPYIIEKLRKISFIYLDFLLFLEIHQISTFSRTNLGEHDLQDGQTTPNPSGFIFKFRRAIKENREDDND